MSPLGGCAVIVGGGLSCNHPGAHGRTITDAVGQLRGAYDEQRVAGRATALAHANGGLFSSQAATILGSAATVRNLRRDIQS